MMKYSTTMGVQKLSESEHNILYANFKVKVQRKQKTERAEVSDFKNTDSQKLFLRRQIVLKSFEK